MTITIGKKPGVLVFAGVLLLFFCINHLLKTNVWGINEWRIYRDLFARQPLNEIINSPQFWDLSAGMTIRIAIDILLTSLLLLLGVYFEKISVRFYQILAVVSIGQLILLAQFIIEFFLIKTKYVSTATVGQLSFLSLDYFASLTSVKYPGSLKYLFLSINLFEILRFIVIAFLLGKTTDVGFRKALSVVGLFCLLPYLTFLLIIAFLNVLNQ
jgi:hypothetical protein